MSYFAELRALYSRKNKHYERTGQRLLPWEEIEKRLAVCTVCEHFTGKSCKLCGCCVGKLTSHFNKLAFPTAECPDGRWSKVDN
jgi:hypothetical protein